MHDFGQLVYLDLQKTGSTYVSEFLNATCNLPVVSEEKHGRISARSYNPQAFYFLSVRHPIAQYRSLFRYGLDKRGGLYTRLAKAGFGSLYDATSDSFNRWLLFIEDPRNARHLGEDYAKVAPFFEVGFLSHRYLMLALSEPLKTLETARGGGGLLGKLSGRKWEGDIADLVDRYGIVNHVIKQESLLDDLRHIALVVKPEFFDKAKVEAFFANTPLINASSSGKSLRFEIEPEVQDLLERREHLLFRHYPKSRSAPAAPLSNLADTRHS